MNGLLSPALFQFCFVASISILKAATNALVVSRFEAAALPYLYVGAAGLTGVWAVLDGSFRSRLGPTPAFFNGTAAMMALLTVGVYFRFPPAVGGLYVFVEAFATVASLRFWAALSEEFRPQQIKRSFGILGGFGMAGSIVGGLIGGVGALLGAIALVGLGLVGGLACARIAGALSGPGTGFERRSVREVTKNGLSSLEFVAKNGLARGLGIFVGLSAALTVVSDFFFRASARVFSDEGLLSAIFAASSTVVGICAMLIQFFLTGRVLSRVGVFPFLALAPCGVLLLGLASCMGPSLAIAFGVKVVESLGSLSLTPTGMQLLYSPLPDSVRVAVRALVDGLVKKLGLAMGGLLLLAGGPLFGKERLVYAVCVVALFVLGTIISLKGRYIAAIDARLKGVKWTGAVAHDADARAVLLKALADPNPARALLAADLLAADPTAHLGPWVRVLLVHPAETVRVRGVQLALKLRLVELVPKLRAMAQADARRPRDEAVFALAILDAQAEQFLESRLNSSEPGLRASAVAAKLLIETGRGEESGPAAQELEAMLSSPQSSVAERRELARLLGRLRGTRWADRIDKLLDDDDPSVRRLAATAAGECEHVEVAPRLIELLADRHVRRAAREALASMGDEVADRLEKVLNDKSQPPPVRYEVPRLLRYLGTERSAKILLYSNVEDDPFLRYRIAIALSRLRRSQEDLPFEKKRSVEAIGRRVDAYLYYLPIFRDLERGLGAGAILVRALADRLDQSFEVVFCLLGLLYQQRSILNLYNRFVAGGARQRAFAVELFENMVDEPLRTRVLPLLERNHRLPSEEGEVARLPARLLELAVSRDEVLRGCAIFTIGSEPGAASLSAHAKEGVVNGPLMEKVFLLEGVGIFERCGVDDLVALAAIATERKYSAGMYVYREDDPGDALYVIVEGAVEAQKDGQAILVVKEKEAFGEVSILDGAPRPAGARAITDIRVLAIDRQDFLDLVSDRPELLKSVFAALTRQLRTVLEVAVAGRVKPVSAEEGPKPAAA